MKIKGLNLVKLSDNHFEEDLGLVSEFAIISGVKPPIVKSEHFSDHLKKEAAFDTESYGLWDSSTPNYHTYYPEASAEDLTPKPEDFIEPVFRMLSASVVRRSWPIDFGKPGVLKKSMKLALGISVMLDHETAVGNTIGVVKDVFWQEEYVDPKSGVTIPAGINGVFKIDGKSNPRIARGIMMDPPSIHSDSVTVRFAWEKSHPSMSDDEFWDKYGSYHSDGQLVRKVATDILFYREVSVCGLGADPHAQVIKPNGIPDPNRAKKYEDSGLALINYKMPKTFFDMGNTTETKFSQYNFNTDSDMTVAVLIAALGLAQVPDLDTEDKLIAHLTGELGKIPTLTSSVSQLTQERDALASKMPSEGILAAIAKPKVSALLALADPENHLQTLENASSGNIEKLRGEVTSLYKQLKGESASEGIISSFSSATFSQLEAFKAEYQLAVEETLPLTCQDCNSHNVARASSSKVPDGKELPLSLEQRKQLDISKKSGFLKP